MKARFLSKGMLVMVVALQVTACTSWRNDLRSPHDVVATSAAARAQHRNGAYVEFKRPLIVNDTIMEGDATRPYIQPVALTDVARLQTRKVDPFLTVAATLGTLAVAQMVLGAVVLFSLPLTAN